MLFINIIYFSEKITKKSSIIKVNLSKNVINEINNDIQDDIPLHPIGNNYFFFLINELLFKNTLSYSIRYYF